MWIRCEWGKQGDHAHLGVIEKVGSNPLGSDAGGGRKTITLIWELSNGWDQIHLDPLWVGVGGGAITPIHA